MRALGGVLLLLLGACEPGDAVWLDPGEARGIVLVTELEGAGQEIRGIALEEESGPLVQSYGGSRPSGSVALLYREALHEIGLPEGRIQRSAVGAPLGELASPLRILSWAGPEEKIFSPLDRIPTEIASILIERPSPCASFEKSSSYLAGARADPSFAVALDDSSALVATEDGLFYRVDREGGIPLTELSSSTPHASAFRDEVSGDLWLVGGDGRVLRGHPDRGGFLEAPSIPLRPQGYWRIDGRRGTGPFELFAVSGRLALAQFRDGEWRVLRGERVPTTDRSRPRIAWAGDGEAVSIGTGTDEITEVRVGGLATVRVPIPPQATVEALQDVRFVGDYGIAAGTRYSRVFLRKEGVWSLLEPAPPQTARVYTVFVFDGGLFFGGQLGRMTEYRPDLGYCESQQLASTSLAEVLPLGGGLLAVAEATDLGVEIVALTPSVPR